MVYSKFWGSRSVFDESKYFPYQEGKIYLGQALQRGIIGWLFGMEFPKNFDVGVDIERHALTIAGSRSGKGACQIIPNLLRWPHNAMVIDPKGENATRTAKEREEKFGQTIYVVDPFEKAEVPDHMRARLNPLDGINENSRRAVEDINVISDGLIQRFNPRDGFFDGGGKTLLSGLCAYVLARAPVKTLPELRRGLHRLQQGGEDAQSIIQQMASCDAFGGLPAAAAGILKADRGASQSFIDTANESTKWLDSAAIKETLEDSTFALSDIKTKPCTIYLVLPPDLLDEHGRFLRLFVRCALSEMAKNDHSDLRCLFILDEFYSLGHMSEIQKAAGLMPSYGVHLWPFLQDYGQLLELYEQNGSETFFANSDITTFFGVKDSLSVEKASQQMGRFTNLDQPRMTPSQIKEYLSKKPGQKTVLRSMIFLDGMRALTTYPKPYFG